MYTQRIGFYVGYFMFVLKKDVHIDPGCLLHQISFIFYLMVAFNLPEPVVERGIFTHKRMSWV